MMFLRFSLGMAKADNAKTGHSNGVPDIRCPYVAALSVSLASQARGTPVILIRAILTFYLRDVTRL